MRSRVFKIVLLLLPTISVAFDEVGQTSNEQAFLSATSFAVVGASDDENKFGTMVLKTLLAHGLDAVPINPFVAESEGIPTLDSLSDLANPTQTAISIVTPPPVTLQILGEAAALGVFAVWLQPGAQDAAVLEYLANSTVSAQGTYIYSSVLGEVPTGPDCRLNSEFPDLISTLSG